jgi:hypothetical protein
MADELKWLIGALIVCVLVITVLIPTTVTLASSFTAVGTATGELWTGTAATAHAVTYTPVVSVVAFKNKTYYSQYNDTVVINGSGSRTLRLDTYAAHGGNDWDNLTITFQLQRVNATNNITWVGGTCSPGGYNTTFTSNTYTLSNADSTCLTPGANLVFTFANTTADETGANVTNITLNYSRYVDSSQYTLASAAGEFTPTNSGYYYTSYTYGTGVTGGTLALVLVLPLLIAAVLLVLFLKSSGMV